MRVVDAKDVIHCDVKGEHQYDLAALFATSGENLVAVVNLRHITAHLIDRAVFADFNYVFVLTHQCVEDIALMRAIPNMTVICPAAANETRAAVHAIAAHEGPVYLRLGRVPVETVTDFPGYQFTIGKSVTLREGTDLTIIATGMVVADALAAAEELEKEGIHARVIDMHTIKPIDREAIRKAAKETGAIVTAEEHNILGGLGGAVAEVVCADCPVPVERVGVKDCFGRSGTAQALLELYGVSKSAIVSAARTVLKR